MKTIIVSKKQGKHKKTYIIQENGHHHKENGHTHSNEKHNSDDTENKDIKLDIGLTAMRKV